MAFSGWGLRNLLDNHQRVTKQGLQVYLRVYNHLLNEDDPDGCGELATYGFQAAVTGSTPLTGFTDVLIAPPPDVSAMSLHNIGMSGGKLFIGAHSFLISHSWVLSRMISLGLEDPYEVFRGERVIGLLYNSRIFSIESIVAESTFGETISWLVMGNMLEQPIAPEV